MIINVPENVRAAICRAADEFGIDEEVLLAFAWVESGFRPDVIKGETKSHSGVKGLFQITGGTWNDIRPGTAYSLDINEQSRTAAMYIKKLMGRYNNQLDLVCIAYNAGPGVANKIKSGYSVRDAVLHYRYRGYKGFGKGKVAEVNSYPRKLNKALSAAMGVTDALDLSGRYQKLENPEHVNQPSKPSVIADSTVTLDGYKFDKNKSIIENVFTNVPLKIMSDMTSIPPEVIRESTLVKKLRSYISGGSK